ncbi:MAG: hypothetical protein QQW96_15540 [Tychonema bourrellyi B0820]|nr:hypothetical protein [Tychonema bourrellyi B0820]
MPVLEKLNIIVEQASCLFCDSQSTVNSQQSTVNSQQSTVNSQHHSGTTGINMSLNPTSSRIPCKLKLDIQYLN